jgi:hypothetical protein
MSGKGRQHSDLVEIAKRNGDFKRNYGTVLGALLYLCSLRAARGRSIYGLAWFARCWQPHYRGWRNLAGG